MASRTSGTGGGPVEAPWDRRCRRDGGDVQGWQHGGATSVRGAEAGDDGGASDGGGGVPVLATAAGELQGAGRGDHLRGGDSADGERQDPAVQTVADEYVPGDCELVAGAVQGGGITDAGVDA